MMNQWDSYQLVAPSRPLHEHAIGLDHDIDEWADPSITQYLSWAVTKRRYDVAIVNYTWMSFALEALPDSIFKIIDTHDVFSNRRALLEANGIAPEFFHTTVDGEARGLARADLVWAIKDSERNYFERKLKAPDALTMLHAEPERGWWIEPPSQDGWLRAGVIGARNNVNRQNLDEFLKTALPIFEKYMAPVKIVIAGGCCDDFKTLRHPNVEVRGRLPEVVDFYRSVDVVIVPMRFSTGLKIKVSEALSSGAPVIAHAHAMEGYPTSERAHLLPSFEAMASELSELAFDRAPLQNLATKSREVCAEIGLSVNTAFDATRIKVAAKFFETVCIVAPMTALAPGSLLHDHLLAAIESIRLAARLELFLTGSIAKPEQELLRRFDLQHQVFVEPAVWRQLGDSAPETWTPIELPELLATRGFARAYVMADCRAALASGPGVLKQAFVRYDAIELAEGDAKGTVDALRKYTEAVIIGASSSLLQRWSGVAGSAKMVCAPLLRSEPSTRLAWTRRDGETPDVFLLAAANDVMALELMKMCERLGVRLRDIDPSDAATARAMVFPTAQFDPLSGLGRARLLVDLAPETILSSAIGELAMCAGVPRIRFVRGPAALGFWRFPSPLRTASIGYLLRSVAAALTDDAFLEQIKSASEREFRAASANDAGWTILWRLFKTPSGRCRNFEDHAAKALFW